MVMTKLLISLMFYFQGVATNPDFNTNLETVNAEVATSVYICNSNTAKKYHLTKTCRGLNACTHSIDAVSLSDAKYKYKRTLCGWED